jgi:UDPglucose 6-dehydrogenase
MNELSGLAEAVGADIESVRKGIGSDSRIGFSFLYAGTGYGGSCFPKDVSALIHTGSENGIDLSLLQSVDQANEKQKHVLVSKVVKRLGANLTGKTFGVWGLSFKPNTDDMRDAPSRVIIRELLSMGAVIQAYDPVAQDEAKKALGLDLSPEQFSKIKFCHSKEEAIQDAAALIVVTEWKEFKVFSFKGAVTAGTPFIVFDGRNLYAPEDMAALDIEYHSIGRATAKPGSHS